MPTSAAATALRIRPLPVAGGESGSERDILSAVHVKAACTCPPGVWSGQGRAGWTMVLAAVQQTRTWSQGPRRWHRCQRLKDAATRKRRAERWSGVVRAITRKGIIFRKMQRRQFNVQYCFHRLGPLWSAEIFYLMQSNY